MFCPFLLQDTGGCDTSLFALPALSYLSYREATALKLAALLRVIGSLISRPDGPPEGLVPAVLKAGQEVANAELLSAAGV